MTSDPDSSRIDRLNQALSGRYRIERELGEGGMATVYLADDLKHERRVALKVLKPELAAVVGAERFLAEIKTTANLQHPHILPLFDSGQAAGFLFYVMPYVEGESLRERLEREKQLPVVEAVRIATDVAEALHSAHQEGVIHRDVKPANILLSKGRPLVADFGIALAVSAAGGGRLTETGLSMGTPYYMSPEQASADREPGAASDVYSLGCVLYEMLVGDPPHTASSAQAVLAKILTDDPRAPAEVRSSIPAHVDAALRKSLEKLPADRFQSAEGFAKALGDSGFRYGEDAAAAPLRLRSRHRFLWPALAAMTLVAAWGWLDRPSLSEPVVRLSVLEGNVLSMDALVGSELSISKDGEQLAFLHEGLDGRPELSVRRLDAYERREIVSNDVISSISFSPDGASLAYHDGASIRRIPLAEGSAGSQALAVSEDRTNPRGVDWEPDGYIYFSDTGQNLARVPEAGGDVEILSSIGDAGVFVSSPAVIPGQDAAFVNISTGGYGEASAFGVLDFTTGALDTLGPGEGARLVDRDVLIWTEAGTLYGQRFDVSTRRGTGSVRALLEGVMSNSSIAVFDVSDNGTLVYHVGEAVEDNLVAVSRAGLRVERSQSANSALGLRMDPQGERVVFEQGLGGDSDVWVLDLRSSVSTRITIGATAAYPTWSLDGRRVAYNRYADGVFELFWKNADGSGLEEVLLASPQREIEVAFVPGSERIVVRQGDRARADGSDIVMYDIGDPESATPIAAEAGNELSPMVSPDGRYVAYASDQLGDWQVFVRPLDSPAELHQVSLDGGAEPLWHPDGSELFYRWANRVRAVPVSTVGSFRLTGRPVELFTTEGLLGNRHHTSYALMSDGETFLFLKSLRVAGTRIVLNWFEELRELMSGS